MQTKSIDEKERKIYSAICRHEGIRAADIAKETGLERREINHLLYSAPFIHDLCFQDTDYRWHGLIRQKVPHTGLGNFCGYYGNVARFRRQSEEEWLEELTDGCRSIGRNLNDSRGLIHSFLDTRQTMMALFEDLAPIDPSDWELCFELRIRRARRIRIFADVLVITGNRVFSLEFKMKDRIEEEEELQAVKYAKYLEVIFGDDYEIIPALVLTKVSDMYTWKNLPESTAEVPVCSGDMLFNLFDEYIGFLQ